MSYIEDKDKFIQNYLPRISELNCEELIALIYDNVYNEDCLIELANSEPFINYKQKEIEQGKHPKLQCVEIITKLHYAYCQLSAMLESRKKLELCKCTAL